MEEQGHEQVQGQEHQNQAYAPPEYSFDNVSLYASIDAASLSSPLKNNFWRSAIWSPDGSVVLTTTEDRLFRIHTLSETNLGTFETHQFKQPDSIASSIWFPTASSLVPESFCFMAGIRDNPVKLIDAKTGNVRASYPIIDHREQFISPYSMAFHPSLSKLYCGCSSFIEIIDLASSSSTRLKTTFTKSSKDGQKGIISALAFAPGATGDFVAGGFDGSVGMYTEDGELEGWLGGVEGRGVTQLSYHPFNPTLLFVASRRSNVIQVYDLHNPSQPLHSLPRKGRTNQRLRFDIDVWGRWLASGDEEGLIRIWDIVSPEVPIVFEKKLHNDAVSSVHLHPYYPLLLTSSGSRIITASESKSDSDETSEDPQSDSDSDDFNSRHENEGDRGTAAPRSKVKDSTMKVWSFLPPITST
ncbi:guanyl nucleotide binding protein, putative [Cryptococcus gattii WM276]|uniref:Guanyl nucleotide binding protein, putative n=2 Tax=Cryptococcus gattii TaxID=37769 RepID=E6RCU8_CRYGW|nr:guanyl nucleotide binding protein, putative [Cryptococcus gattii WM276]ADV24623.1 guanyl nucleotide binding protein, putative [Cryptococcus gattii WM276]KIR80204.1 guanyl nucleotide binding protein [Cryptococcus gattii EJB2]KJE00707.1 guanyl nucleotide binding protein [Cryptococcus gattii NT-10]